MTSPPHESDAAFSARMLEQLDPVPPSAELQRRVAEIPIRSAMAPARWWWPSSSLWQPILGLATATLLGLFVGSQDLFFMEGDANVGDARATLDPQWSQDPHAPLPSPSARKRGTVPRNEAERTNGPPGAPPPPSAASFPLEKESADSATTGRASELAADDLTALEDSFILAFGDQWQDPDWLEGETL